MSGAKPERSLLKLLAATLAGVLLGGAITAARLYMIAPTPEEELAASLDTNPLFQVAIRHDPELRALYLARLEAAHARGGAAAAAEEARAIGQEIGRALAPNLLPVAPDAVLADYLEITTEYLATAYESDPDACYAFAHGKASGGALALPADVIRRLSNVMQNVLAAAGTNPVTMKAGEWEAGHAKIEEIRTRIENGDEAAQMYFGDQAGKPATTAAERKGSCLFVTRMYQGLAGVEAPLRYQALRVLSSPPRPAPAPAAPAGPLSGQV